MPYSNRSSARSSIDLSQEKDLLPTWTTQKPAPSRRATRGRRFWLFISGLSLFTLYFLLNYTGPWESLNPEELKAAAKSAHSIVMSKWKAADMEAVDQLPDSRFAYATLLTGSVADAKGDADLDPYFVSTRLLCYQILHANDTKSALGAPCLVLATPNVREDKLDRLRQDGATIVPVQRVETSWAFTDVSTWQDVLSKLHLWELTQYELIAFMDNDIVLNKPLDGIFQDPAVTVMQTMDDSNAFRADEGDLPFEYVFAGIPEVKESHHYPPSEETHDFHNINYLNAGFFVTRPSQEMFDYQMKILSIPNRFDPKLPEQNLWNYIFRREGNMPWTQLRSTWNIHYPTLEDVKLGVASVHDKFWNPSHKNMSSFLMRHKRRMEDFYAERDIATHSIPA